MEKILKDAFFMREALKEARKAFEADEVPVGAVIVLDDTIIARGHNLTERLQDVTAHAEIQAITAAAQYLGAKYLTGCTLYVSLEPCLMCAGALAWAQVDRIVFGAKDPKKGYSSFSREAIPDNIKVSEGILVEESSALLKDFFRRKRD